jgi:hypothetical protein
VGPELGTKGLLCLTQMLHVPQQVRLVVLIEGIILFRVDALVQLILLIVVLPVLARGTLDPRVCSRLLVLRQESLIIELLHLR